LALSNLEKDKNSFGSLTFTTAIFSTISVLFTLPPLFHLNIAPNEFAPGFIPLRMINADLKYLIVLGCMSLVSGIVLVRSHLHGKIVPIPRPLLVFGCLFLLAVLISTAISHNPIRAWVSALQWHIVPLLFAWSLAQLKWSRTMVISFLSLLLIGGFLSCLVTLDQHYRWTDWSHRLVRNGYAGIIFNRNFAAEYHAPLIPLALGLAFYVKPWWGRVLCLVSILLIFLPAVSLSMARGAWVGHMGGVIGVSLGLLLFLRFHLAQSEAAKAVKGKSWFVPTGFILLGLSLPAFLFTSDFWKKGGRGWERLDFGEEETFQFLDPQTNLPEKQVMEKKPIIAQTAEANELKSITNPSKSGSSMRRLVLWEDAFKECFSDDFLFGKGTDHYELFYHESAELSDKNWGKTLVRFVHNDFIQTFYENGFFGIIGWLGVWGFVCWQGMVACCRFFRTGDVGELGIRIGLIACILCFLIEAFFEFPTRSPCAMFVGWSALGMLLGMNLKSGETEEKKSFTLFKRPLLNLGIGVVGVVTPIYTGFLIKDLFWANVYHFQGRAAGDAKKPQLSLHFHREAISHAPWQHLSRKAEGFLLITAEKRYLDAMKSIEDTLRVHPGCLQAHQNRIALLINEFKNPNAAKIAYLDMKKAAPFHPFTKTEEKKLKNLFLSNREKKP
jgi:hypothetical protein